MMAPLLNVVASTSPYPLSNSQIKSNLLMQNSMLLELKGVEVKKWGRDKGSLKRMFMAGLHQSI